MYQSRRHTTDGFTLIELLLAMGGIAFLLLFIVFAIVHVTGLYTKGITIRQINQVGRQLTDEISRSVRYGGSVTSLPDNNRLCVAGRAYIWNTPAAPNTNKFASPGNPSVTFVSIDDSKYCEVAHKDDYIPTSARTVVGSLVSVQVFSVTQVGAAPLYDVQAILSTTGANAPTVTTVGGVTTYECSPQFGQFCAFGEFKTTVYARD
jgi:type II secretory pathway pseudopilin PulG